MLTRCYDSDHEKYPNYGGRGIGVCDRWKDDMQTFLDDMGPCPEGYTLDRINSNDDYYPENCRWASQQTQQNNRTNNVWVQWGDEERTISDWARELGLKRDTLYRRIVVLGQSFPDAARPLYARRAA